MHIFLADGISGVLDAPMTRSREILGCEQFRILRKERLEQRLKEGIVTTFSYEGHF